MTHTGARARKRPRVFKTRHANAIAREGAKFDAALALWRARAHARPRMAQFRSQPVAQEMPVAVWRALAAPNTSAPPGPPAPGWLAGLWTSAGAARELHEDFVVAVRASRTLSALACAALVLLALGALLLALRWVRRARQTR